MEAFLWTLVAETTLETPPRRGGQAVWSNNDNALLREMDDNNRGWVTDFVGERAFAISEKGYFALVTWQVEVGDVIFVLFGGSILYLLRPHGNEYVFISECYVHGLMDGEAMAFLEDGRASVEDVVIV
jgi:hypothetical protein